jgi:hypothetical protein
MGLAVGMMSASSEDAFMDAGFTVLGVPGALLPLLLLPRLAREAAAQRAAVGTTSETGPAS